MKVNETLKSLRQAKKLTQAEAAGQLDVSLSSYQKYERDKNSVVPSLDVLLRIADLFGVTTDYLLGRETGEPDTLDTLTAEFNMSELEKKILDNYLSLPDDMRGDLMDFLEKSVKEVMTENSD